MLLFRPGLNSPKQRQRLPVPHPCLSLLWPWPTLVLLVLFVLFAFPVCAGILALPTPGHWLAACPPPNRSLLWVYFCSVYPSGIRSWPIPHPREGSGIHECMFYCPPLGKPHARRVNPKRPNSPPNKSLLAAVQKRALFHHFSPLEPLVHSPSVSKPVLKFIFVCYFPPPLWENPYARHMRSNWPILAQKVASGRK